MNIFDFAMLIKDWDKLKPSTQEFFLTFAFNESYEGDFKFADDIIDDAIKYLESVSIWGKVNTTELIDKINHWRPKK